jgi:uncharacterized lipoprotein
MKFKGLFFVALSALVIGIAGCSKEETTDATPTDAGAAAPAAGGAAGGNAPAGAMPAPPGTPTGTPTTG